MGAQNGLAHTLPTLFPHHQFLKSIGITTLLCISLFFAYPLSHCLFTGVYMSFLRGGCLKWHFSSPGNGSRWANRGQAWANVGKLVLIQLIVTSQNFSGQHLLPQ